MNLNHDILTGAGLPEVYDSDSILELDRLPGTLGVLGAGVIGSEYACTFAALGTKVHLIDGRDVLLSFLDSEVSRALTMVMERDGIIFHWKAQCSGCEAGTGEAGKVALQLSSGERLVVDAVLVAAGRKSNIDALNLEAGHRLRSHLCAELAEGLLLYLAAARCVQHGYASDCALPTDFLFLLPAGRPGPRCCLAFLMSAIHVGGRPRRFAPPIARRLRLRIASPSCSCS
jgi:hypothetical protein